jgi:hypothetical protein
MWTHKTDAAPTAQFKLARKPTGSGEASFRKLTAPDNRCKNGLLSGSPKSGAIRADTVKNGTSLIAKDHHERPKNRTRPMFYASKTLFFYSCDDFPIID